MDRDNQQLVAPVTVYSVVALPNKVTDLNAAANTLPTLLASSTAPSPPNLWRPPITAANKAGRTAATR